MAWQMSRVRFDMGYDDYSMVAMDVGDNAIFLTDTNDGESLVINPDNWDLIKETIDQWIADGHLDDRS